ncbi:TRAP transporter large permease [Marinilabilia salmonicolor]|jgi:tripartite ATP-independent transporter DctM subunit|uniref:Tripartite ATP-independent transporter DctM subunit n=1 Tax=Marinilabilia salmonicolor TaxID=989 RepID=A0A2T0XFS6_9BACT|nr:TRAP transporter large permease subunit [Marinilabilia salmonicolor]PRY97799.1 tripartite ATP-independent transporter DctM subunit [Marinilabilia salmonicolor]RCW32498.1 tripartite ATP-independent transporter DctM subunit [Marinilabilia salmonicolor]
MELDMLGIIVLVSSFIFFLVIGTPIAYSIGLSAMATMLVSFDVLPAFSTMAQRMATGLESFSLLAIPFFILAGQLMNSGGIAMRLIEFAKVLVGRLPGGLAMVNVTANMLFGAISGSAAASASAMGTIMGPRMEKEGYDKNFSAAINVTSATTGLSIPPSNILIVYALASGGTSIAALFLAGYVPGILTGLAIMLVGSVYAYRKKYPVGDKIPFKQGVKKFLDAIPSLMMLVVVIGGIIAGIFTATEAAAIAVVYSLILALIYKEITVKHLPTILIKTVRTAGMVLLLIAASIGLSWVMSFENIPSTVSSALLSLSSNPFVILLIINLALLAVGIFMDMTPAVLIFTPIFLPIVTTQLGLDPIHFGIIMILNLNVGLVTPPVGAVLFIGCSVAKLKIQDLIKPLIPFYIAMFVVLLLVTFIPEISLWVPHFFGY